VIDNHIRKFGLHIRAVDGDAILPVMVDAAVAQLTAAGATVHDASADALNRLHAALTTVQREALVDKVSAHWTVWQKANSEDHHVQLLMADLDLTPDQVDVSWVFDAYGAPEAVRVSMWRL